MSVVAVVRAACLSLVLAACDDPPPPVAVENGRLAAELYPDPPRIAILLDGAEVWSTRGGGDAPYGFAATGTRASTVEMQFGSFKFAESKPSWQGVRELRAITKTATGATFELRASDRSLGTGTLTLDPDTLHVRIELAADIAERFTIGAELQGDDEHLVGLGGQSFEVDHKGETVPLWVQEDGIGKSAQADNNYAGVWFLEGRKHSTHTPMPMVLSSKGYAIVLDTDARAVFDLGGGKEGAARFETWDKKLDLNVFLGEDGSPRDALARMIAWVGKPARPPAHMFAPWVDALFGSANVRRVATKLRDSGISSSVIWSEDWRGGSNGAFGYELDEDWRVDRTLYPDFEQVGDDLRGMGFAFVTYHNTFIDSTADVFTEATDKGYAIQKPDGTPFTFTGVKFNSSTLLDTTHTEAVAWAKSVMSEAIELGSDGWMADFAEWLPTDAVLASGEDPLLVHNRYPRDWAIMNEEMFAQPPAGRPQGIYFMRSAWLHSQPHVQVMWAGDQQTDWSEGDGLPSVIPIGLGLGLTGFPYFGHDIGGYMDQGTTTTSEELFYRWTTFGALSPVMRTHHGRQVMENVQWEYNAGTVAHFRRWTRFHMQLAAYLAGSVASFEQEGLPLFRLVALEYPDEDWAWTTIDEYLLGDRILVAPVQVMGATSRSVKLPPGTWYPLLGTEPVSGGDDITATAERTEIPAFVPAGSILVLYPDGVDTMLASPARASATTLAEVAADREVWIFSGTADNPAHARWNDESGPLGTAQWTWSGRPAGALPTTAMFNGAPVTVTTDGRWAAVTVTGNGTLEIGGGTLTIARPTSGTVTVRLR